MALKNYAVLKGHIINGRVAGQGQSHYSIHVVDQHKDYRVAVNVRSSAAGFGKDLWFLLDEDFHHPIIAALQKLELGRHMQSSDAAQRQASGLALDYIRSNLFDRTKMKLFPAFIQGAHNDLNEQIDDLVQKLAGDEESLIYAFGETWIDEDIKDKVFGFTPGNGIHNIHMNQGDLTGSYEKEDGIYQDGALIFYVASEKRYLAYFTKFQSQSWHTNDQTGHAIDGQGGDITASSGQQGGVIGQGTHGGGNPINSNNDPDLQVRIIAALINPVGPAPETETVTLLNTTAQPINLNGWSLLDKQKNKTALQGTLPAGETLRVKVQPPMVLPNSGGLISLLNQKGIKVHGVSYTAQQANHEGETVVFANN